LTAEVLVGMGTRCVVLVSRSGIVKHANQGLSERLEALERSGATIAIERCDVGNEEQVSALLERVRAKYGPLKTIVHAAGALSDALLGRQDADSMRRVFAPKADGAWYLHKHSSSDSIERMIFFSSISSLFGNLGQSNYSAANSFLDDLARWRMSKGLCSRCIQWSGIDDIGMAAALDSGFKLADYLCTNAVGMKICLRVILNTFPSLPINVALLPRIFFPSSFAASLQNQKIISEMVCCVLNCLFCLNLVSLFLVALVNDV